MNIITLTVVLIGILFLVFHFLLYRKRPDMEICHHILSGLSVGFIVLGILLFMSGCNEAQKVPAQNIKPLNQHLTPAPQKWKDAYGDTLETQVVFNFVVLRQNDFIIANVMNKMHSNDPNDPNNLKLRIEKLEARVYNNEEK